MPPKRAADADTWRRLIGPALRVVDSLRDAGYGELDFRLGGGTVLMFRFSHRISKDIDIFTHDAQALGLLSPRLNEIAEHESPLGYQEQANALKLLLPDGDVDFIVAAPVIPDAPCEAMVYEGRTVMLDASSEILAKKLLYRADAFKSRDVFDMSAALALDRPSVVAALRATRPARPALLRRLTTMLAVPEDDLLPRYRDDGGWAGLRAGHGRTADQGGGRDRRAGQRPTLPRADHPPHAGQGERWLTWTGRSTQA